MKRPMEHARKRRPGSSRNAAIPKRTIHVMIIPKLQRVNFKFKAPQSFLKFQK